MPNDAPAPNTSSLPTPTGPAFGRGTAALCLTAAAFVLVLLFCRLGSGRTLGSHEAFAIVPAREMLASGDWVVPRYGGLPRLQKPPLAYWVVATSARLCGGLDEFSARLPAAVSALLLAALVGCWAGRWYGPRVGFAAAVVQATSVWSATYARKVEVDMLQCLLSTGAAFLIATQPESEPRGRAFLRWTGISALLSVAWLAKFHYAAAMILVPAVVWWGWTRRFRAVLQLLNPVGLAMLAAAAIVWPRLLVQRVPDAWDILRTETIGRAVGELSRDPVWFYLPRLFALTLPWGPLALPAIRRSLSAIRETGDSREKFLWAWFGTGLAIVTASSTKHPQYLFAVLPVWSLLGGRGMVLGLEHLAARPPGRPLRSAALSGLAAVAGLCVAVPACLAKWPHLAPPIYAMAGLLVGSVALLAGLVAARRLVAAGHVVAAAGIVGQIVLATSILPAQDHRAPGARFAREMRRMLGPETPCGAHAVGMDPVVYYLGDPVFRTESPRDVAARLARDGRLHLVVQESDVAELVPCGRVRTLARCEIRPDEARPKHPPFVLVEVLPHVPDIGPVPADRVASNTASGERSR